MISQVDASRRPDETQVANWASCSLQQEHRHHSNRPPLISQLSANAFAIRLFAVDFKLCRRFSIGSD